MKNINWDDVLQIGELDKNSETVMRTIEKTIQKYTQPLKCRQNASLPWLNSDIYQLMKKRDIALKKSLLTKTQTDIIHFKSLRNKVISEMRKAKTAYFEQLIIESGGNSSSLCKCINKLSKREGTQRKPLVELNINGRLNTDSTEIANEFNRYFTQSVEELAMRFKTIQLPQNVINGTPSSFHISEVDEHKILQIINQLNNSRAKDIFGMDTAFVKTYSACLIKPLVNLIN